MLNHELELILWLSGIVAFIIIVILLIVSQDEMDDDAIEYATKVLKKMFGVANDE